MTESGYPGEEQQPSGGDAYPGEPVQMKTAPVTTERGANYPGEEEEPSVTGEFSKGFEGGSYGAAKSLGGTLNILAAAVGSKELQGTADNLMNWGESHENDVAPRIGSIQDIKSPQDFAHWMAYNAGSLLPAAGAAIGTDVAVGAATTALTKSPQAGIAAGLGAQFGINYILDAGSVYAGLRAKGYDKPAAAAAAGLPMAILDMVDFKIVAGRLVAKPVEEAIEKSAGKAIAQQVGKGALTGAVTQGAKEAVSAGTESAVTDEPFLTPNTISRVLNAAASGGFGGGLLGGGIEGVHRAFDLVRPEPARKPLSDLGTEDRPEATAEAQTAPISAPTEAVPTWDTIQKGDQVTLYRGSNRVDDSGGEWWTTDPKKAALYGDVQSVTLPAETIGRNAARGHNGADEFVFPGTKPPELGESVSTAPIDRSQTEPLNQEAAAPVEGEQPAPVEGQKLLPAPPEKAVLPEGLRTYEDYDAKTNPFLGRTIADTLVQTTPSDITADRGAVDHVLLAQDVLQARMEGGSDRFETLMQKSLERTGLSEDEAAAKWAEWKPYFTGEKNLTDAFSHEVTVTNPTQGDELEQAARTAIPHDDVTVMPVQDGQYYQPVEDGHWAVFADSPQQVTDAGGLIAVHQAYEDLPNSTRKSVEDDYHTFAEKYNASTFGDFIWKSMGSDERLAPLVEALHEHIQRTGGDETVAEAAGRLSPFSQISLRDWGSEGGQAADRDAATAAGGEAAALRNADVPPEGVPEHRQLEALFDTVPTDETVEAGTEVEPGLREDLKADLDTASGFWGKALTLLQLAELNQHVEPLQRYVKLVQEMWRRKTKYTSRGDETVRSWMTLGKEQAQGVGRYLTERTIMSDRLGRKLTPEEEGALGKQTGLTASGKRVADQVDTDMKMVRDALKAGLLANVDRLFTGGEQEAANALRMQVLTDFGQLDQKNYFPLARFGKNAVQVVAKHEVDFAGKTWAKGETVLFDLKETKREQNSRYEELQTKFNKKDFTVSTDKVKDAEYSMRWFPPSLLESMQSEMKLTPEQAGAFKEFLAKMSPGQSFKKSMLSRKDIAGFSKDGERVYGNYMMHAANHLARLESYASLSDSINDLGMQADQIKAPGGRAETRRELQMTLNRHYDYLMNPGNDMSWLKAGIYRWYFTFMPRQAFVNLIQGPLMTWSHLSDIHGTVPASVELAKSYAYWLKNFPDMRKAERVLPADEAAAISAHKDVNDESFASNLAGVAMGSPLTKLNVRHGLGSKAAGFLDMGLLPFSMSEQLNRRASFLAAYRLSKAAGEEGTQAGESARTVVQKAQGEYAKWNRPEMARSALGNLMFTMKSYTQNTLYFYGSRQPGWARMAAIQLGLAGVMGLPFAHDIADVADVVGTTIKQWLGAKDPYFDSQMELRNAINGIGISPDLIMHGGSRKSMGLSGLGQMFGLPIPAMDLSNNFGFGTIVPGADVLHDLLMHGTSKDTNDAAVQAGSDVLGVGASMGMNFYRALFSPDLRPLARLAKVLPPAMANLLESYRVQSEGAYTDSKGNPLIPFDPGDPEHNAELIGKALGMSPTRLSERREANQALEDKALYYATQRELAIGNFVYAALAKDREALDSARAGIRTFNQTAAPGQAVRGEELSQAVRARAKDRALRVQGMPTQKRMFPFMKDYEGAYPQD